ncbi:MAG: TIGR02677 family protein [Pirellulaceae bacterium]
MKEDLSRIKPFAYLDSEKTASYRAIMSIFLDAKSQFEIHLRLEEVGSRMREFASFENSEPRDFESDLMQLCDWGNIKRTRDTSEFRTVEEFKNPPSLYQLTREGEAAERAVRFYHENVIEPGELQTAALDMIREQLQCLLNYSQQTELDSKKVHIALSMLESYFDQLTTKAQIFIGSIQRAIDLHDYELDVFLVYKERLIEYLDRFIKELVFATDDIKDIINRIESSDVSRLLFAAATHDVVDAIDTGDEAIESARDSWRLRWGGLKKWFFGTSDSQSQAETLRTCARSAIPAFLIAVSGINNRRVASSDRPTDYRALARWFAQLDDDGEAHRLWRTAFSMAPSRHLRVDDDTLYARDQDPIGSNTSWMDSPPVLISPRLRTSGQQHRRGRAVKVIDRSADKARLAELAAQEAEQIEKARLTLATGQQTRLSNLQTLNKNEFLLFLDLLGKALTNQKSTSESVVATSSDGTLQIKLWPTHDDAIARIETEDGEFIGLDHFLEIVDLTVEQPSSPGANSEIAIKAGQHDRQEVGS